MRRITVQKFLLSFLFVIIYCFLFQSKVNAFFSCSTGASSDTIVRNTSGDFTFVVNNSDSVPITFVKIVRPSSNWAITGSSGHVGENEVTFDTNINPSDSNWFTVSIQAADNTDSGNWNVEASDGGDAISCGNPPASIINPSLDELTISNATISDVTSDSIKIIWNTNRDANSVVDYGFDSGYGSEQADPTFTSSHNITLFGLIPNTTYHFMLKSIDNYGNTIQTNDNSFVSAVQSSAGTVTTITTEKTVTNTVTNSNTKTVIVTPAPDVNPPLIYVDTDFSKPFTQSPQIQGISKDNKAVVRVEYSIDNGENYLPVDKQGSIGKASTTFSFIPAYLDDGNYQLKIKATDSSGNVGYSNTYILVIDRIPSQVSGVLFSLGPQVLSPRQDGSILVPELQSFKITLSEVGGAIGVYIYADFLSDLQASSSSNMRKFKLVKNPDNGLWSANISLEKQGEYQLRFSAVDGAGNKTDRNLNKIVVVKSGKVNSSNAKITVHFYDINTGEWKIWDGSSYGQKNPVNVDSKGKYGIFLPSGSYYLQIEAYGYQSQVTNFFTLNDSMPINADFSLTPSKLLIDLKLIKLYWPDFSSLTVDLSNQIPKSVNNKNSLIEQKLPFFSLSDGFKSDSLTGKASILTFLNTWSPSSTEQISILNNFSMVKVYNSVTIIEGEKSSKIGIFKKRGSYSLPMYTDPDATLVTSYELSVLPTSYFIDRKGIVKDVMVGVLSKDEIESKLLEISQ